jgi:hypothetical protein|tara:strand:- start:2898 stop:3506 length:609 start_codon:yes stop_codon:yes gene_type:complete
MARNINDLVKTEVESGKFVNAHLISLSLYDPVGNIEFHYHVTDYFKGIQYNNNYYDPAGNLLNISGLSEGNKFEIQKINLTLSGISRIFISSLLNLKYTSRDITVFKQFYRTTSSNTYQNLYEPIGTPVEIFHGRIDSPTINDDPENDVTTVSLSATSIFADFDKKAGRHTNDTEQKFHHPNDNFFKLWGKIDEDLIWGKED